MNDLLNILLLASLGSVIALLGGVIFLLVKKWSRILAKFSMPFAAGVLVTTAMLGLLPEAVHMMGQKAFLVALVSFLVAYLFETLFCDLHHHDSEDHDHHHTSSIPLVIVGDTIHNLIDGITIAAAYFVNPGLGLVTAVSTFLHEVPHEIGDFGILLKAGFSRKKVFLVNLISALSTIVGAMLVYFWMPSQSVLGVLLAVAAGMFLYLGASDFLPKASKGIDGLKAVLVILLGVGMMYLTLSAVPHSHDHENQHETHHLEEEHEEHMDDDHLHEEHDEHEDDQEHTHEDEIDLR